MGANDKLRELAAKAVGRVEVVRFEDIGLEYQVHELNARGKSELEGIVASTRSVSRPARDDSDDLSADPAGDAAATEMFRIVDPAENLELRTSIIALCVTDMSGAKLIDKVDAESRELVANLPTRFVDGLFDTAWELNGMSVKARKKREVDAAKN